jgi:hypothetical protein
MDPAGVTDSVPARRPRAAVIVPILFATVPIVSMFWAALGSDGSAPLAALGFMVFAVVPFAVIAFVLLRAAFVGWLWWAMLIYAVVAGLFGVIFCVSILTSESSTAAIGFVFLPVYQLAGIPVAVLIGALAAWVGARRR